MDIITRNLIFNIFNHLKMPKDVECLRGKIQMSMQFFFQCLKGLWKLFLPNKNLLKHTQNIKSVSFKFYQFDFQYPKKRTVCCRCILKMVLLPSKKTKCVCSDQK